jgi:CheY-like chemotaxis protein
MQKILIAHTSQELTIALCDMLRDQFEIITCDDGNTALEYIRTQHPDALILDFALPYRDGLSVLENAGEYLPAVVLATATCCSDYTKVTAQALGVSYIMVLPCEVPYIVHRLMDMICYHYPKEKPAAVSQKDIAKHLIDLHMPQTLDGFIQLKAGIPMFAQDTAQRLNKELYPAIAKQCGYGNGQLVERSIRSAIRISWQRCDPTVWRSYFPGNPDKCPTNKEFICQLANLLIK